jgi:hypothetical protein
MLGERVMPRRFAILVAGLLLLQLPPVNADPLATTSTYFAIRPDFRRCAPPLCGGYWVKRLHLTYTTDHQGLVCTECYVASIDWSASGLSHAQATEFHSDIAAGRGLMRGTIVARAFSGFGSMGSFAATEAWRSATVKAPTGLFYRLTDNGVRCATAPCFWMHGVKLNSTVNFDISSLDLSATGAAALSSSTLPAALSSTGLLVAGTRHTIVGEGPSGDGLRFVASQFYVRVPSKLTN